MLSVQLFGTPQLQRDGVVLQVNRRKSRALVYYLAAHAAPVTRERVLALFWPDHERAAAQQILRTTLHGLRKQLGAALVAADDTLSLDARVDTRRFEAGLNATDTETLHQALAWYSGTFLADFTLPDTPEFEDWAAAERDRYCHLAIRGLVTLAERLETQHQFHPALDALNRALALEPLQEDIQRAAIRLHYRAGDRAGAIRRYETLCELLDRELGVPPMAETRDLYDAIITDRLEGGQPERRDPPGVVAFALSPVSRFTLYALRAEALPFTGREAELAQLRQASDAQRLVVVEGEPGIGKTRLVGEHMRLTEVLPLTGTGRELEQSLPYRPIIEALRGLIERPEWPDLHAQLQLPAVWRNEIARLLPDFAAPGVDIALPLLAQPADESRLWEGVSQFLQAVARCWPVTLFLDDLHWADASTLALFGYLIRQPVSVPINYVATTRPLAPRSAAATFLHTLTREGRLTRITLARLPSEAMVTLARHFSPSHAPQLATWLTQNGEGNPYIIEELIRHARAEGLLRDDTTFDTSMIDTAPAVPQTVYSLIQSRLARLSDAARRMVDAAVAAGREFDFDVVARAAELSEDAALDALDELRAAALVFPRDGARYVFDHSLTMEVAYREVGEARHRQMHRRIASAMETVYHHQLDSVAGLIATHYAEGNAPERAAPYALRAGQRATGLAAWAEAIAFYEQALAGSAEQEHGAILMALGDAAQHAGEGERAEHAFHRALALAEARGDVVAANAARVAMGQALLPVSRFREVISWAQAALATGDPSTVASAEFLWGTALSLEGADLAGAAAHLHRAYDANTDTTSRARIGFELGSVAAQRGDLPAAIAHYRVALAAAQRTTDDSALQWHILAYNNLAYHLLLLEDPDASRYAQAGIQLAEEKGVLMLQPYLRSTLGEIALAAGDLETAEQQFRTGLALAERLAMPERIAGMTANLGLVALQRGEIDQARECLSSALARADALGTLHLAAQIRIWLAPLLPPDAARAHLNTARSIAESGGRSRLLAQVEREERRLAQRPGGGQGKGADGQE